MANSSSSAVLRHLSAKDKEESIQTLIEISLLSLRLNGIKVKSVNDITHFRDSLRDRLRESQSTTFKKSCRTERFPFSDSYGTVKDALDQNEKSVESIVHHAFFDKSEGQIIRLIDSFFDECRATSNGMRVNQLPNALQLLSITQFMPKESRNRLYEAYSHDKDGWIDRETFAKVVIIFWNNIMRQHERQTRQEFAADDDDDESSFSRSSEDENENDESHLQPIPPRHRTHSPIHHKAPDYRGVQSKIKHQVRADKLEHQSSSSSRRRQQQRHRSSGDTTNSSSSSSRNCVAEVGQHQDDDDNIDDVGEREKQHFYSYDK